LQYAKDKYALRLRKIESSSDILKHRRITHEEEPQIDVKRSNEIVKYSYIALEEES